MSFTPGDLVRRTTDHSGLFRVVSVDNEWGTMVVECVAPPTTAWMTEGEIEENLQRRYVRDGA